MAEGSGGRHDAQKSTRPVEQSPPNQALATVVIDAQLILVATFV